MDKQLFSITCPYRGYLHAIGLTGPIVQPKSISYNQLKNLINSGATVYLWKGSQNKLLTREEFNKLTIDTTDATSGVKSIPPVSIPEKVDVEDGFIDATQCELREADGIKVDETITEQQTEKNTVSSTPEESNDEINTESVDEGTDVNTVVDTVLEVEETAYTGTDEEDTDTVTEDATTNENTVADAANNEVIFADLMKKIEAGTVTGVEEFNSLGLSKNKVKKLTQALNKATAASI